MTLDSYLFFGVIEPVLIQMKRIFQENNSSLSISQGLMNARGTEVPSSVLCVVLYGKLPRMEEGRPAWDTSW